MQLLQRLQSTHGTYLGRRISYSNREEGGPYARVPMWGDFAWSVRKGTSPVPRLTRDHACNAWDGTLQRSGTAFLRVACNSFSTQNLLLQGDLFGFRIHEPDLWDPISIVRTNWSIASKLDVAIALRTN